MDHIRRRARIAVDLTVVLTTVLDSVEARIIDLSEHGAQIVGIAMATNAKFQIEYQGQTIYAQCIWSEVDRMGVRFPFSITDGPLNDALLMAMPSAMQGQSMIEDDGFSGERDLIASHSTGGTAIRRPAAPTFGRRSAS